MIFDIIARIMTGWLVCGLVAWLIEYGIIKLMYRLLDRVDRVTNDDTSALRKKVDRLSDETLQSAAVMACCMKGPIILFEILAIICSGVFSKSKK